MYWLYVAAAGICIISFAVIYKIVVVLAETNQNMSNKSNKTAITRDTVSNAAIRKWIDTANKNMRKSFIERRNLWYIIFVVFSAIVSFLASLVYLKSLPTAIVLGIGGIVIPEQFIFYYEQNKKEKINEQLGPMIRIFTAEYINSGSEIAALGRVAQRMPNPIGGIIRKAYRSLIAGNKTDDVLVELSKDLDSEYGRMFVQILRMGMEGEEVREMYNSIALRTSMQYELIKQSKSSAFMDRTLLVILDFAVVGVFIFMLNQSPDNYPFFTQNSMGRIVVFLSAISLVGASILDRIMMGGEVDD